MDLALNEYEAPTHELDPELQLGGEPQAAVDLDAAPAAEEAVEADPKAELDPEAAPEAEAPVRHRNQRARAQKGTAHRSFDISMGTYVKEDGEEFQGAATDLRRDRADVEDMRVDLVTDKPRTLFVKHPEKPTEGQLFERKPGGRRVTHQRGTLDKANTHHVMDPEKLFIGAGPVAEDVRQGGFGDCYFETALLAVVNNDPGHISKMIRMSGNTAHVTFHRKVKGKWVPVTIHTSDQLLTRKDDEGKRGLVGAGVRIPEDPVELSWWAETHGSTLELHKRYVWEVALWAALIEKAFADFAEQYGQYGTSEFDDENPRGSSGYDIIASGGWTHECYGMIYGNAAAEGVSEDMEYTAGGNAVLENPAALQRLVEYETTRANTGPGQTQGFLEASVSSDVSASRGSDVCDQVLGQLAVEDTLAELAAKRDPGDDQARIDRALRSIERTQLRLQVDLFKILLASFDQSDEANNAVAAMAAAMSKPDLHPALWDDTRHPSYQHLRECLGILSNVGTDHGPGRRMIYADHAYNVHSVTLRDRSGQVLTLAPADVAGKLGDIDPLTSIVVMENPHAGNEPDLRGEGPTDKRPDGRFELTLDQFLRHFSELGIGAVTH